MEVLKDNPDINKILSRVFLEGNPRPDYQNEIVERTNEGVILVKQLLHQQKTPTFIPKKKPSSPKLLSDLEVQNFIVDGCLQMEPSPDLPAELHEHIARKASEMYRDEFNPGNNLLAKIPELWHVLNSDSAVGVLKSLLGDDYILHAHCHSHMARGKPSFHQTPHSPGLQSTLLPVTRCPLIKPSWFFV